jgi:hypothetical protein
MREGTRPTLDKYNQDDGDEDESGEEEFYEN